MRLRDYQTECLRKIDNEKARGIQKMLVVIPTGTGKTIIFAHKIKDTDKRSLILVHRDELLRQAEDKLLTVHPEADIGVVKAERNELGSKITIASVQTLSRRKRLSQIEGCPFGLIVTDEAHHAVADSYGRIYDALWDDKDSDQIHLGVTATADRMDKTNLGRVFQKIVYHRNLLDMIKLGWLSDLRCVQVQTNISLGGVRIRMGDFATNDLSNIVNTENRNELVVEAYKKYAKDRLSLCFTVDVQHAGDLTDTFNRNDVETATLTGNTPLEERRQILKDFHNRQLQVICNCMVLTEGYDEPALDCIILARPTQSGLLYTQMIGRGTRTFPGKKDCLILDVADNYGRHNIMSMPKLLGVPKENADEGKTVTEWPMSISGADRSISTIKGKGLVAHERNLFADSSLIWIEGKNGRFTLKMGLTGAIRIYPSKQIGKYVALYYPKGGGGEFITKKPVDLSWAMGLAESEALEKSAGDTVLFDKNASWRGRPPSQKQRQLLKKHGIVLDALATKGDAADQISTLFEYGDSEKFKKDIREAVQESEQLTFGEILRLDTSNKY